MTSQAIVLLVVLISASAACFLYILLRRHRRSSREVGARSPDGQAAGESYQDKLVGGSSVSPSESYPAMEAAKDELGPVTLRNYEPEAPAEHSYPGAVINEEAQREEEQSRLETEITPTSSTAGLRDVDAYESERESIPAQGLTSTSVSDEEVQHSITGLNYLENADAIMSELVEQQADENGGAASDSNLIERPEVHANDIESRTNGVSADSLDSEKVSASRKTTEGLETSNDIGMGQELDEAAENQPSTGVLPAPSTIPDPVLQTQASDLEDTAFTQHDDDVEGKAVFKLEEEAEETAVPPSFDEPWREGRKERQKKPRKYEGLARSTPKTGELKQRDRHADGEEVAARDRSLPLEVRIRFDRGGFCMLSLIAKRSNKLPEEIAVSTQSGDLALLAMQDEWYQDVFSDEIAHILENGTIWTQKDARELHTWSLSGRPLYVLADRADISGFVSQACLEIGREHIVLCRAAIRDTVDDAIKQTGAIPASILDESLGVPEGWIAFRGVVPTAPVTPVSYADVLNALRPLPRIVISMEAGIRLEYTNWLEGYPPMIKVYGDPEHAAEVTIDGKVAERGGDGCFLGPGWDSVGSHTIWCSGVSRSYSIVPFASSWEPWDAYAFPVNYGTDRRIAVCGPLLRCASEANQSWLVAITVPQTNPVLLGQVPGQQAIAESASGMRGTSLVASPPFSPVWALPRDPLHCDKKVTRILLVGDVPALDAKLVNSRQREVYRSIETWCHFILNASRKGLRTDPDTEEIRALWLQFKLMARRILRGRK